MARYNEILVGRYNRMVQKLLSMKGAATLVTFSDEAIAVLPLFYGVENRYLEGWDRFGAVTGASGAAANQSGTRLRNPGGSNVIAVIEKIFVSPAAATSILGYNGATAADLAVIAPLTAARLDSRGRPQPTLIASNQNTVPALPTFGSQFHQSSPAAAQQPYDIILNDDHEMPVLPGDAVQLLANVVNVGIVVSWVWRERFLEDSERA